MKTKIPYFAPILGCLLGIFTPCYAQEADTLQSPSDSVLISVEDTDTEEEDMQDSTIITFGRRSRLIVSRDENGNRRVELTTRPRSRTFDDESDDEWEEWNEDEDKDEHNYNSRRRRNRSEVGFLSFDLGVANYYNDGNWGADAATPELEVRTFRPGAHVALHIIPTRVSLIGRGVVNLETAITIDWTNLYFTEDIQLQNDTEVFTFERTGVNYDRNKLMLRYAQIPLLLNIDTDPGGNDGLELSVGGFAGVLWGSRTKQKSDEFGKVKVRDDFNLNNFRYGLTARVKIRWFDVYFNLHLSQLLDEDEDAGINAQLFTAGFNLFEF